MNKQPQQYEEFFVQYMPETWWDSSYIIAAHLKHTYFSINQCLSSSLFCTFSIMNKEPQEYEEFFAQYMLETWWDSSYIISAQLKHTYSSINQCLSGSLFCAFSIMNKEPQQYEVFFVLYTIVHDWNLVRFIIHYKYTLEAH